MSIHIALKIGAGSTSERIEIFSTIVFRADSHPMTTASVWGGRYCRRVNAGDRIECQRWRRRQSLSRIVVEGCDRSLPCSYYKVEDDVPVTIHLGHVLEFSVGDSGDNVGEHSGKFQREVTFSIPTSNCFLWGVGIFSQFFLCCFYFLL